ncbi:MAG: PadR family transcriptional regulator [Actinomycetota bacterium]
MREPTFLILAALAPRPGHGYGVIQAVDELSDGRVRLRAGTLYTALDRLVGDGLLAVSGEEVVDGRNRRYYAITADGRRALAEQADRLAANVDVARRQLAGGSA